jgi:hypothetical protein
MVTKACESLCEVCALHKGGAMPQINSHLHRASENMLPVAPCAYNTCKLSCEFIGKKQDILLQITQGHFQVNHKG